MRIKSHDIMIVQQIVSLVIIVCISSLILGHIICCILDQCRHCTQHPPADNEDEGEAAVVEIPGPRVLTTTESVPSSDVPEYIQRTNR